MSARSDQASTVAASVREPRNERNERIYLALPPLDSAEYLTLLKSATAAELPPSVLVRVYREAHPSPAADATLARLLAPNDKHGYLVALRSAARRRSARLDAYSPEDLVSDTVGEIVATIAGPEGELGVGSWVSYLHQCMAHAYRKLVGRRGERVTVRVDALDGTAGGQDGVDAAGAAHIPWHGSVAPSNLEWLEGFMKYQVGNIAEKRIRAVGRDLFSEAPRAVSSSDPRNKKTLTHQFGVNRQTIYEWQRAARAVLRGALERQNEREIDTSFLKSID